MSDMRVEIMGFTERDNIRIRVSFGEFRSDILVTVSMPIGEAVGYAVRRFLSNEADEKADSWMKHRAEHKTAGT